VQSAEWEMGPGAEWGRAERRPGIQGAVKSTHSAVAPIGNRLGLARLVAFCGLPIHDTAPTRRRGATIAANPWQTRFGPGWPKPVIFWFWGVLRGFARVKFYEFEVQLSIIHSYLESIS